MIVCGEYSPFGYTVIDGKTGEVLFSAGNHKSRKRQTVAPDSPNAVIVSLLRRYCAKKTRDIAKQRCANYGGVRRAEEPGRARSRPMPQRSGQRSTRLAVMPGSRRARRHRT